MDFIQFLNGNFIFPLLVLVLGVVYFANRFKNNRKFKR